MPKSLREILLLSRRSVGESLLGLAFCLLFASTAFGQGAYVPARTVTSTVNGLMRGIQATITVCAANTAGTPCAPALANTLFKDSGLTQPLANPTTTDALGNYPQMALAAGTYTITETAAGFTGFSWQITIACAAGGCTAGPLTVTNLTVSGSFKPTQTWTQEIYPSGLSGADCGAKINNALATYGGNIILHINNSCGFTQWTAINTSLPSVILDFIECGTYQPSTILLSGANSGVIGKGAINASFGVPSCATLKRPNSLNGAYQVQLNGNNDYIQNVSFDGNQSNNPTGGVGIYVNNAQAVTLEGIKIYSQPSHGIWFQSNGTTNASRGALMRMLEITSNLGDAVFAQGTADLLVEGPSTFDNNGTQATVNTQNAATGGCSANCVTITSGALTTDSSLVGAQVRINGTLFQIASLQSTTLFSLTTAPGTLTGVPMDLGECWEASDSPTPHFTGFECGQSKNDGFLFYGTAAGLGGQGGGFGPMFSGANQIGNHAAHGIEILGHSGATVVSYGGVITGIQFIGSGFLLANNTYDAIHLVDGGANAISGNVFGNKASPNAFRSGINASETSSGRAFQNNIGANADSPSINAWGTQFHVDSTFNGVLGRKIITNTGGGCTNSLDIFDGSSGAGAPHIFTANSGGTLQLKNSPCSLFMMQLGQTGNLQIGGTLGDNSGHIMGLTLKKGSGAGNYTTASTSYVAADTTNLCFTVTIPTGWKLGIQASGSLGTSTAVVQALVALADNTSCASTTSVLIQNQTFGNAAGNAEPFSLSWVINGDGASHNILLEFATTNAADSALMLNTSASFSPQMVFTLMPSN